MRRAPHLPPLKRVGHKGADHVTPGNTLASFERALEMGVDMIEFDVLRSGGRLVLAHDRDDARARTPLTLAEGLDHFATDAYAEVELVVDLKLPGYERDVVDGLAARGLTERSIVSSMYLGSLDSVGALAPAQRRGWSVPRVRRDYTRSLLAPAAYAYARVIRRRLPAAAQRLLRDGRFEAVMSHWLLVTPRLLARVHAASAQLFVWTVDSAERIAELEALGVDGVITNDPRLFEATLSGG